MSVCCQTRLRNLATTSFQSAGGQCPSFMITSVVRSVAIRSTLTIESTRKPVEKKDGFPVVIKISRCEIIAGTTELIAQMTISLYLSCVTVSTTAGRIFDWVGMVKGKSIRIISPEFIYYLTEFDLCIVLVNVLARIIPKLEGFLR